MDKLIHPNGCARKWILAGGPVQGSNHRNDGRPTVPGIPGERFLLAEAEAPIFGAWETTEADLVRLYPTQEISSQNLQVISAGGWAVPPKRSRRSLSTNGGATPSSLCEGGRPRIQFEGFASRQRISFKRSAKDHEFAHPPDPKSKSRVPGDRFCSLGWKQRRPCKILATLHCFLNRRDLPFLSLKHAQTPSLSQFSRRLSSP